MTHSESSSPGGPSAETALGRIRVARPDDLLEEITGDRLPLEPLEAAYPTYLAAVTFDGEGDLYSAVRGYERALRISRAHVVEPDSARRGMEHECTERLIEVLTGWAATADVDGDTELAVHLRTWVERVRHPAERGSGDWSMEELLDSDNYVVPQPGQPRQ